MNHVLIALIIGVAAGIIDTLPMIVKKMNLYANLSAFTHWVFLGLIISFVSWNIPSWLKGLVVAELSAIPIVLMIVKDEKKAIIPITVMSAILGAGIGIAGKVFIG